MQSQVGPAKHTCKHEHMRNIQGADLAAQATAQAQAQKALLVDASPQSTVWLSEAFAVLIAGMQHLVLRERTCWLLSYACITQIHILVTITWD